MLVPTEGIRVGVPHIDNQHLKLIDKINEMISMGPQVFHKKEIESTLIFLKEFARIHFADEEKLQIDSNYPKYEQHKLAHQYFFNELSQMTQEYFANKNDDHAFVLVIVSFMAEWIGSHVRVIDAEFFKYYNQYTADLKTKSQ